MWSFEFKEFNKVTSEANIGTYFVWKRYLVSEPPLSKLPKKVQKEITELLDELKEGKQLSMFFF